ncbi:MAG: DEAD/DEAH box helicase [Bacteroidetes bacterium]|nr:DEAD/DEAH box helicase [Bacteroidota bacterium]MCW5897078.1 DEAD/DEAH box helicase [Bacteroidota bacterium]
MAIHAILRSKKVVTNLLVVAPRNAFISWEDELSLCFEGDLMKATRLTGGRERISDLLRDNPSISLITYHQLPTVINELLVFLQRNKVHLVLDESHRIKSGPPGVHFSAVIRMATLGIRRDILSGTPMPQSYNDLVPQFDFLWPGSHVLEPSKFNSATEEQHQYVNRRIKPIYARTTKKELGLPEVKRVNTSVTLGAIQRELYGFLRSEAARVLSGMGKEQVVRFRELGRQAVHLLQLASNPMLISSSDEYPNETYPIPSDSRAWELFYDFSKYEHPAKVEYAVRRTKEITSHGNKVVLWSSFVRNIELLENLLSNLNPVSIHGGVDTGSELELESREGRIRRFHVDSECKVLIANPAACGEGISLHRVCHHALYLDRTFNAAHYLQSVDRIHRLGLPPGVITHVEILQAHDTIDQVVDNRLKEKIAAMAQVLDDPDLRALAYDPEDVVEDMPAGIDTRDIAEIQNHILSGA